MTEKSLHLRGPTPNVQFIMMLSYHGFNTFLPGNVTQAVVEEATKS